MIHRNGERTTCGLSEAQTTRVNLESEAEPPHFFTLASQHEVSAGPENPFHGLGAILCSIIVYNMFVCPHSHIKGGASQLGN